MVCKFEMLFVVHQTGRLMMARMEPEASLDNASTGTQQILLEETAHFYTVPDVYSVLHKFQCIFFPTESSSPFVPHNNSEGDQSG